MRSVESRWAETSSVSPSRRQRACRITSRLVRMARCGSPNKTSTRSDASNRLHCPRARVTSQTQLEPVLTLAGTPDPFAAQPNGLAVDRHGNIYVGEDSVAGVGGVVD